MAIYHRPYESDGDEDQASGDVCALQVNVHAGVYVEQKGTYLGDSDYGDHRHAGVRGYGSFLHAHAYASGYRAIGG